MTRAIASVRSAGALRPEERVVAGRVGGVLWVIASLSVIAMALVLPADEVHRSTLVEMGIGGCLWGGFSGLFLDYSRLPVWLIHLSTAAGAVGIAFAMALSGGARSPAWACLFYVVVFAAYFFTPPAATAYFLGCVAIGCIVLLGSSSASHAEGAGTVVVAAPAFLVLGAAIVGAKHFMWNLRLRAERLAAEQGALPRVATGVVSGEPADRFYQLVSLEAAQLLAGSGAAILRLDDPAEAVTLGSWAEQPDRQYEVGARCPVPEQSEVSRALAAGLTIRIDGHPPAGEIGRLGYRSSIISPIKVDTLARVGGDEFAWILPQTTGEEARAAVERARRRIRALDPQPVRVTMSAGICDSSWTADPSEPVRLADRALYSSKEHGRDQVRVYAPTSADELAAH